jgi:hypothetical protein
MSTRTVELRSDLAPRIEAAADEVEAARATLDVALERRNELLAQAIDEGMSWGQACRLGRVSRGTLGPILAAASG